MIFDVDNPETVLQQLGSFIHPPDQRFAGLVSRMRFPRVDHLQRTHLPREQANALGITEEQVSTLIRRRAPGEADGHYSFVERHTCTLPDLLDQRALSLRVRSLNL